MKLDSISDLFAKTWQLFEKDFKVALQIFIIPALLILVGQLLIIRNTPAALLLSMVINLISVIFSIVASIALITLFGKGTNFAQSYENGFKLFWPSIWIAILVMLATFGGFVLFVIPGIMLAIQLAVVNYVLVLNGKQGLAALSQSREYIKGYWWAYFGRGILLGLVFGGLALVVFLPVQLLLGDVAGAVAYGILLLFITPFFGAYQFELFDNLRRLKPAVANETVAHETGFLKVAMVLGIIGIVFFIILFYIAIIFLPTIITKWQASYPNGSFYEISPTSGPVGTMVTLSGIVTPDATDTITMNGYIAATDVPLSASDTLTFAIPAALAPDCDPNSACPQFRLSVAPGTYSIDTLQTGPQGYETVFIGRFTVTATSSDY